MGLLEWIYYIRPENSSVDCSPGGSADTPFTEVLRNALVRGTCSQKGSIEVVDWG